MTRLEGYEQIIGGDDLAIRAARAVAGSVLLLCLSVGLLSAAPTEFLWSGAPSLSAVDFAAFLDVVNARRPYANASEWRVGKVAHAIHANSGGQIQKFLSAYVCSEAGDCASDLGCGALRAMCSVRVPWDGASSDDDAADADRRGALEDAGGAAVDDATAFRGSQGLSLVGLGVVSADPTAASARPLYESLHDVSAADVALLPSAPSCAVVEVSWPSMPHFSARFVSNGAAPAGEYAVADLEGAIQADHDAFLTGRRGSWDRWLDQHLGLWYAGGEEKCDALISDLHADLEAAGVPYAERQQADALLIYAGFGYGAGALAVEYQFADCAAERAL
ncbi:hypothetical protein JL722_1026 [Aureococcus anophagefferens]|nr:hypothetical protein JL722_1026 [Aureococcus anophagefferens]